MQQLIAKLQDKKNSTYSKVLFVGYTCLVLVATLMPTALIKSQGESWIQSLSFKNGDKVIHFTLFFIFTTLFFYAISFKNKFHYIWIPILFGILIEIGQQTMGMGRTFDFFDILANSLGVLLAYYLIVNKNR